MGGVEIISEQSISSKKNLIIKTISSAFSPIRLKNTKTTKTYIFGSQDETVSRGKNLVKPHEC